jgi:hypothetical protein
MACRLWKKASPAAEEAEAEEEEAVLLVLL